MLTALEGAVTESVLATVREGEMQIRGEAAIPLHEMDSDRLAQDLPFSLIRHDKGELDFVAAVREDASGFALRVNKTGSLTEGSFKALAAVSAKAVEWLPGLLSVGGRKGRHAGELSWGGLSAELAPVAGSSLAQWVVTIGGSPQAPTDLSKALKLLAIDFQPLRVQEAAETFRIREGVGLPTNKAANRS